MSLYADTSLLVSYYVSDANSADAQALIGTVTSPLVFTALHRLEMRNALELGVFRQLLTPSQARAAWNDVKRDLAAGRLVPHAVNWIPVLRRAADYATAHTATVGCRSLDVLHVAAAKNLSATEFLTFDRRQKSLGLLIGLVVKP